MGSPLIPSPGQAWHRDPKPVEVERKSPLRRSPACEREVSRWFRLDGRDGS